MASLLRRHELVPELLDALLNAPALNPPPGAEVNFQRLYRHAGVDPWSVSQVTGVTLFVAIRMFTKLRIVKKFTIDDGFLLFAWVLYFTFSIYAFEVSEVPNKPGIHQWNMRVGDALKFSKVFYQGQFFWDVGIIALKVSILLQYVRVFVSPGQRDATFWSCHTLIWITVLSNLAFALTGIFGCWPIRGGWDFTIPAKCINRRASFLIASIVNCVTDIAIFVVPLRCIWKLHLMDIRMKLGLSLVFLVAILACTASAARIYFSALMFFTDDSMWCLTAMAYWCGPEVTFGFIAACFPVFPRFWGYVWKILTSRMKNEDQSLPPSAQVGVEPKPQPKGRLGVGRSMDVEFYELVVKTTTSHASSQRITESRDEDTAEILAPKQRADANQHVPDASGKRKSISSV